MSAASTALAGWAVEPTTYPRYFEKQTWSTSAAAPESQNKSNTAANGSARPAGPASVKGVSASVRAVVVGADTTRDDIRAAQRGRGSARPSPHRRGKTPSGLVEPASSVYGPAPVCGTSPSSSRPRTRPFQGCNTGS